ncbi:effector-associated constant component EACC1 [Streptomyces melanogenes]|uniref:effector-associated constant component EACC1 n=1 Tax=Streptomyces melanogenes TaxID=67326 RepID=UPI00167CC67A|nr:hypothetical protein [Streptomyces melanogenes]GGP33674.1 hypothetical protein GCM10010278_07620 [Streptomyces melanogenes]
MAEVRISVGSAAGATALTGWLLRDPSVARSGTTIEPASPAAAPATTMGSVDTITAVANSTVSLLGLLVSTAAWRRPRGARTPTVRITESDGTVLEGTPEDVLRILQARREPEQSDS